jgi:hypothetical protein
MGGIAPFLVNDARIVEGYPVNGLWVIPLDNWNPTTRRHTAAIDRVFNGTLDPKYFGSVSTNYRIGRLTLTAMADFAAGNKKLDFSHYWDTRVRSGDHYLSLIEKPSGKATPAADSLVDYVNVIGSTVFPEKADYLSLSEMALSYNIPDTWIRTTGFRRASLRLSGRNLKMWTKFPGVDPRLSYRGNVPVGGGSDFDSTPVSRVFLFTVRASR